VTAIRLSPELRAAIDKWAERQDDKPVRSEAIRRLVEQSLQVFDKDLGEKSAQKPRGPRGGPDVARKIITAAGLAKPSRKSSEMAGEVIDRIGDDAATDEERASRKRRLIKGPTEFREMRGQKPKDGKK
jgi:hypothetical protein